jgi:Holliday junction resolvase RusA-like endonuclease
MKAYAGSFPNPTVPIAGIMSFYFRRLKTVKRVHHTVKPDVDNLSKTTMDSLKPYKVKRALKQEGVIADDAQVTDLYLRKRYTLKSSKVVIRLWAYEQKDTLEENYQIQGILNLLP